MAFFYLMRHGETDWNAQKRLCGRTDVPLSDVGRRQAEMLAQRLRQTPFAALYTSPLRRALETATIIGHAIGFEPVREARLIELSYGTWEGRTSDEVRNASPEIYRAWEQNPASVAPPEGESGNQLIERLQPFMEELSQKYPTGNVAMVCHRTVCRLLTCHLMGVPLAAYRTRVPMDNAALNIFESTEGKWSVRKINDTSHLPSPLPEIAIGRE